MTLQVIGVGVGRTGTYSLKLAIDQLGLGPCHHMEEVLLDQARHVPLWAAALFGVLAFGVAHAYQGLKQIPIVMVLGAAFTGVYLLTGSLWLAMLFHALVDILQGRTGYDAVTRHRHLQALADPSTTEVSPPSEGYLKG